MRQVQKGKRRKPRKKTEPLAEGIGRTKRGRDWASMSDEGLVDFAKIFLEENRLTGRKELVKADYGLYQVLRVRGLLDSVGFEEKRRPQRCWASMSDEELVAHAKMFLEKNDLTSRKELYKADRGLYGVLRKRRLLDKIGLDNQMRDWASMDDEELIGYAQKYLEENGVGGRKELYKADRGLYNILIGRGLLDKVGFEEKLRDWASMDDEELVRFAQSFMEEEEIGRKGKLKKVDRGLYGVLRKRRLLDRLLPCSKRRTYNFFTKMSDEELLEYARVIIGEKELKGRKELNRADSGLYDVLRRRKLLDEVFASIEEANRLVEQRGAVQEVVDAMAEFDSS